MVFMSVLVLFFFFKQKTAYEMRISDWSSDVCSSDLATPSLAFAQAGDPFAKATTGAASFRESLTQFALVVGGIGMVACLMLGFFGKLNWKRSEEHTSELQSLMRISYAVFCLKKKNNHDNNQHLRQ